MESTAHAYTDAATSGISALESIRGYWNSRALGYSQKTRMDLDASEEMWLNRLLPFMDGGGEEDHELEGALPQA